MLTKKQRDLLLYIHDRMKEGEIAPSFDEMRDALGLKSKSGVHRLITGLVERGYIERLPHRARALEIKKMPENYPASSANVSQQQPSAISALEPVPLCGKIAAGTPIEAIKDDGEHIDVPPFMLGSGEHYALTVEGDSMINAGINDKDTVIIRRGETAENGQIVVALIENKEATLKRFYRQKGKIILKPENDIYDEQVYEPSQVRIQGKIVSLMRSYSNSG